MSRLAPHWALAALLSFGTILFAAGGSISGKVAESNGDASGLADVVVVEHNSGVARSFRADDLGSYRATDLAPGRYDVTARSVRTGALVANTTEVHSGEQITLPLQLTGGGAVFTIFNPASTPLAGSGYLGALRNGAEITRGEEGGNIEGFGPFAPRGNFGVNSIGQRSGDNNFQVDGLDNNDPWLRGPILNPQAEDIASASLTAVYAPATEGHQAGAVLSVVTASGTAAWHGSGFEYLRNSALNASNFFDGTSKPGTTRNQFGGAVGGPVVGKDWFFFADIDAIRARDGLTVISTVPTIAEKAGNFGSGAIYNPLSITQTDATTFVRQPFAGNQIPLSLIPVQARSLIALYPNPNLPGFVNNFRYTPSAIDNSARYALRTDKALSSRNKLFARLNYERNATQSPSALPGRAGNDQAQHADNAILQVNALGAAASQTFTLRPGLTNELRAGLTRLDWTGTPADQSANSAASLALPGLTAGGLPVVSPTGYAQLGAAQGLPGAMRSTSYEIRDTVSWRKGRHSLVAGFQMLRRHVDGNVVDFTSRGTFAFTPDYTDLPNTPNTGNAIASLLLGDPSEVRRDVQLQDYRLRGWEMAGYIQDTFHIGHRLLITAGLRYSYDPPVTEASNRMVNFNYSRTNPAIDQFAGAGGVNAYGGLSFNKRTIAPRIGFALDVGTDGSTILRGGFSQDYDPGSYIAEGALARNAPYATQLDLYNGSLQLGQTLAGGIYPPISNPFSGTAFATVAAIYAIEPKSYTQYADQWGLFLDHRFSPRLSVELSGSGSMGIHLYESYNINQPYPAPTPYSYERYPFPSSPDYRIQYLGFAGGSTYYGGQAKVTGQLRSDLHVLATYRYAKSLDDSNPPETTQDSRPTGPQYIYNLRGNRSVSPFDVPQRLIVNAAYDLPFRGSGAGHPLESIFGNWRLDTLITLQSGFPFTPVLAINGLNNGGHQLPNRAGSGALPASQRSATPWFNTSLSAGSPGTAFVIPAPFQYGNSGFDILRGPGLATADAALSRTYALGEKLHLQTRVEVANLFNRTNLALPNAVLGVDSSGAISHTATPSRNMQLLARLTW